MNESIIVGLVVGGGVAIVGALAGHFLRLREMRDHWEKEKQRMEALWAEEERRRKSDRRREAREADLRMVRDAVDAAIEVVSRVSVLGWQQVDSKSRLAPLFEVLKDLDKAVLVASSLQDQDLADRCMQVRGHFVGWLDLLDMNTRGTKVGKEKEYEEFRSQLKVTGALVWLRIRELLEEG